MIDWNKLEHLPMQNLNKLVFLLFKKNEIKKAAAITYASVANFNYDKK